MNRLVMRLTWMGFGWVVCSAAAAGIVGWPAVAATFVVAWKIGGDE